MRPNNFAIIRKHEISCGHRVYGHEGKCRNLHGHNYGFEITVATKPDLSGMELDHEGRVVDFATLKELLCGWLEREWDHKMLLWDEDPIAKHLKVLGDSDAVVLLPCNPTAENLAAHFYMVANKLLENSAVRVVRIGIWETSKCYAEYAREQ